MSFRASTIPEWYTQDWHPAVGRGELPVTTWEALESELEDLLPPGPGLENARTSLRMLWLESSRMSPMALLQAILTNLAASLDPQRTRTRSAAASTIPTSASGPLPRWSFTDVEVALGHTWTGLSFRIASRRHHDLLQRRGEPMSPIEVAGALILLVSGLPTRGAVAATHAALLASGRKAA